MCVIRRCYNDEVHPACGARAAYRVKFKHEPMVWRYCADCAASARRWYPEDIEWIESVRRDGGETMEV